MGGMKCRACRRYVLSWSHILILIILGIAGVAVLLEILSRVT